VGAAHRIGHSLSVAERQDRGTYDPAGILLCQKSEVGVEYLRRRRVTAQLKVRVTGGIRQDRGIYAVSIHGGKPRLDIAPGPGKKMRVGDYFFG